MPAVRVSGGVLNSQSLTGSLRFFKVIGGEDMFEYTVGTAQTVPPNEGDPEVIVPGAAVQGGEASGPTVYQYFVPVGAPVPNSAAERIVKILIEKATLVQFAVVGDELHLAFENTGFGWGADAPGDAATEMEDAIQTSGPGGDGVHGAGDPGSNDPPVPDDSNTGTTVDLSGVTVEEVDFALA